MKMNGLKFAAKAKDFENKEQLKKNLDTLLKKPLKALLDPAVHEKFAFCYEVDYFGPGEGFMSIGKSIEIQKMYKTKRSKGQGHEGKIDKKKVAFGECWLNDAGVVAFNPMGGKIKQMQLKSVIKSIKLLKMKIGVNFELVQGAAITEVPAETVAEMPADNNTADNQSESSDAADALKNLSNRIFKAFAPIQKQFDREVADKVVADLKVWMSTYKGSEDAIKVAQKDVGTKVQKVAGYLKKAIQVDNAIDKIIDPLFKNIDQFNNLVDHSTEKGQQLKAAIEKGFNEASTMAANIKDLELIEVLKDYIKVLND